MLNNSWVVYEIPGHKVGMCQANHFPRRPNGQVNALHGRPKRSRVKSEDVKVLQRLEEITRLEAREIETEWQDKLGYLSDMDRHWLALQQPEVRANMSASQTGITHSDEAKAKISAARKGRPHSDEAKLNMSTSHMGKTLSAETKAKMSAARKAYLENKKNGGNR